MAAPDSDLVFIDAPDKAYLSITGRAEIRRDTARAAEIWKSTGQVWLPGGPDDPILRISARPDDIGYAKAPVLAISRPADIAIRFFMVCSLRI